MVAFGTCFFFFLQLRIADEFKDFDEDSRYRPYRPVPRGLVKLSELAILFALGAAVQLALALLWNPRGMLLLLIAWIYLAAMSKEFFIGKWLRKKHILYMISHMMIMPLVDLYATSADWLSSGGHAPRGLTAFLLASYFNGLAIEIGRKIRSPHDEEVGVDTYTRLWGRKVAVSCWWLVMLAVMGFAIFVATRMHLAIVVGSLLCTIFSGAIVIGVLFLRSPVSGRGKWIETYSGAWTLALYLSLGLLPHFVGGGAS